MTARQNLIKRLDSLCHDIVCLKWSKCVTCGSPSSPTTGHLITRGKLSVKYDLKNLSRQCANCNSLHETNKGPYIAWFLKTYGEKELNDLRFRADQDIKSIKTWQLQVILDQFKIIKQSLQ